MAIHITNRAELEAIINDMTEHYVLDNDIDLENVAWNPIGSKSNPFEGILDGQGYTIRNFAMSDTLPNHSYYGLFAWVGKDIGDVSLDKGVVVNLNFDNISFINMNGICGVICGGLGGHFEHVPGSSGINNCHITNMYIRTRYGWTGGICGEMAQGIIIDCTVEGQILTDTPFVNPHPVWLSHMGGVIGRMIPYKNIYFPVQDVLTKIVRDCTADVLIGRGPTGGAGVTYAGGFVGSMESRNSITIQDCVANGNVTLRVTPYARMIGGFAGLMCGNTFRCVSNGNVDISNSVTFSTFGDNYNIGGFCGAILPSTGVIRDCVNNGFTRVELNINHANYIGGFAGGTDTSYTFSSSLNDIINVKNCYNTGNVVIADLRSFSTVQDDSVSFDAVGGFIGRNMWIFRNQAHQMDIYNCYNEGNINANRVRHVKSLGGFVGEWVSDRETNILEKCYSHCEINIQKSSTTGNFTILVGGFVGAADSGSIIRNCYAKGEINIDEIDLNQPLDEDIRHLYIRCGGFVGRYQRLDGQQFPNFIWGKILNCYSSCDIFYDLWIFDGVEYDPEDDDPIWNKYHFGQRLGGFVGTYVWRENYIQNCYFAGDLRYLSLFDVPFEDIDVVPSARFVYSLNWNYQQGENRIINCSYTKHNDINPYGLRIFTPNPPLPGDIKYYTLSELGYGTEALNSDEYKSVITHPVYAQGTSGGMSSDMMQPFYYF